MNTRKKSFSIYDDTDNYTERNFLLAQHRHANLPRRIMLVALGGYVIYFLFRPDLHTFQNCVVLATFVLLSSAVVSILNATATPVYLYSNHYVLRRDRQMIGWLGTSQTVLLNLLVGAGLWSASVKNVSGGVLLLVAGAAIGYCLVFCLYCTRRRKALKLYFDKSEMHLASSLPFNFWTGLGALGAASSGIPLIYNEGTPMIAFVVCIFGFINLSFQGMIWCILPPIPFQYDTDRNLRPIRFARDALVACIGGAGAASAWCLLLSEAGGSQTTIACRTMGLFCGLLFVASAHSLSNYFARLERVSGMLRRTFNGTITVCFRCLSERLISKPGYVACFSCKSDHGRFEIAPMQLKRARKMEDVRSMMFFAEMVFAAGLVFIYFRSI